MKNVFMLKDNIVDKKLIEIIKIQNFSTKKIVNREINNLIEFFAEHFTNRDKFKAQDLLEQQNAPMRRKDAMLISYFGGLLSMILFALIIVVIVPEGQDKDFDRPNAEQEIYASIFTFRFLLMILFTICSAGVAIKFLREYKVNYIFIFQLDPNYKVTYLQLLRVTLTLLTVWGICFLG
jgi:hypothetical protein